MSAPTSVNTTSADEAAIPATATASALAAPPAHAVPMDLSRRALRTAQGAQRAIRGVVPQPQYRLARLGPAGLSGIAALCAAAVVTLVLWLPAHQSVATLSSELSGPAALRLPGSPQGPAERLIAQLPTRLQIPAVLGQVLAQAKASGVALDEGHYAYTPSKPGSLGRYTFEFPVKAPYPSVRDFIDRTLTAIPAAGLDKLKIERKTIGDPTITADIGFIVLVRGS